MGSFSIKVDANKLKLMMDFYSIYPKKNIPYAHFQSICDSFNVTFYHSNTVLFQGSNFDEELLLWNFKENKLFVNNHIGSDEVGTGDYFGSIVVVAVFFKKEQFKLIEKLKIDDSKKLNDVLILDLGPKLMKIFDFEASILPNYKYNELNINKNKLLSIMHHKVILKLINKVGEKDVFIDQFVSKEGFEKHLNLKVNYHFETKADSKYYAVAIASIIARYLFLKDFDEKFKDFDPKPIKGASIQLDEISKVLVAKYGIEFLEKYAKFSFANTKKIIK